MSVHEQGKAPTPHAEDGAHYTSAIQSEVLPELKRKKKRRSIARVLIEWQPGKVYKTIVGSIAVSTTIFFVQNLKELNKWEAYRNTNFYPTPPPGCIDYVDMDRDLRIELPKPANAISSFGEARQLREQGIEFEFHAPVSNVRSSAENFEPVNTDLAETYRQIRDYFDHHIETFELSSGLVVNVYSTIDNPGFTIDHQRFDELAHASLDPSLRISDAHYSELLACTQQGFGLPESVAGNELDLMLMPSTGWCIGHLRYFQIPPDHPKPGCVSQGASPPRLLAEYLMYDMVNEEIMILTFKDYDDPEEQIKKINQVIAHEFAHFWDNQTDRDFEPHQQERYVEAIERTMIAQDIADMDNHVRPAIVHKKDP